MNSNVCRLTMVGKVCIIGAGPSGLAVLCWYAKLKREGKVGASSNSQATLCRSSRR